MGISLNNPLVQTVIKGLLRQGYSFNKAWRAMPDFDLPKFNKNNFLKTCREIEGFWKNEAKVRNQDPFSPIQKGAMVETDLLEAQPYRVFGTVEGYNTETGEKWENTWSYYDDLNRGKSLWEDEYLNRFGQYWKEQGIEITEVRTRNVQHNKLFPY